VLSVVAGEWHVQPSPGPDQPYIYTGPGYGYAFTATDGQGQPIVEHLDAITQIAVRPALLPQVHPSPLSHRHHQSRDQAQAIVT
jgi:hypothetical protein